MQIKPRFSTKTLLALVVIMSLILGKQARYTINERKALEIIYSRGGIVSFDYATESHASGLHDFPRNRRSDLKKKPPGPEWLHEFIGVEYFCEPVSVHVGHSDFDDADLACITNLANIRLLNIEYTKITDAGISMLKQCTSLEEIWINGNNLSNNSMNGIISLKNIKSINMADTLIDDDGLEYLWKYGIDGSSYSGRLLRLEELDLSGTQVTDRSLKYLSNSPSSIWRLKLFRTKTSKDAVDELRQAWPNSHILH